MYVNVTTTLGNSTRMHFVAGLYIYTIFRSTELCVSSNPFPAPPSFPPSPCRHTPLPLRRGNGETDRKPGLARQPHCSMLQCLLATDSLSAYFRSLHWKREINQDNPLGMGGKVAEAYAGLSAEVRMALSTPSKHFLTWRKMVVHLDEQSNPMTYCCRNETNEIVNRKWCCKDIG